MSSALIQTTDAKPELGDEFEYLTVGIHLTGQWFPLVFDPKSPPQGRDLNELGKDGWLLKHVHQITDQMTFAIFMRVRRRITTL